MWRILTSSKLALWLIALMAVEMGIAMFIPQTELSDPNYRAWAIRNQVLLPLVEVLRLNRFFTAPIFLITVSIFCINVFCCTYLQFKIAWTNFKKSKIKGQELIKLKVDHLIPKDLTKTIKGVLEKYQFRVRFAKDKEQIIILAEKNRWGLWGMAMFHIAILWTILGAVWGDLNKVEGNTFIVEGFSIIEQHQDYANIKEGLLFREKHAGFKVEIHQVGLEYRGKLAPQLDRVLLSISEAGQEVLKDTIKTNQLVHYRGYKIKLNRRGFAPILQVDRGGPPRYSLISLDVHQELSGGESYGQKTFIKDLQKEIDFLFFPSPPDENKRNVDYQINNPLLQLSYQDEQGKIQVKTIGLNEPIIINGQKVSMVDAKPWVELIMYKTPGVYQVYFGFALALLGLSIYYGLPYQKITVNVSPEGDLSVYAYAKLSSGTFNNRVEKVIDEVSMISSEFDNQKRREEEIW